MPARPLAAAVAALAMLLAACSGSQAGTTDPGESTVVATTGVLGDITRTVLADTGAQVEVLLPPGADPHGYAPSAADGVALREAALVVANGLQLEESLLDTLGAAADEGVPVIEVGELVDPLPAGGGGDHAEDEDEDDADGGHADGDHADEDDHGSLDPHVWLDPVRVGRIAREIAAAYAEVDPAAADAVMAAAEAYAQRMTELDAELQELVATLPEDRREVVTNHDALGYLAARYDLEVVGTVLPGTSTGAEVSAQRFADLVELLEETGVPAIFVETSSSDELARSLAGEVGAIEVVELFTGSLGEPGGGADTVAGMIRTDVERIVAALEG